MATIGRPKKPFDPDQFEKLCALQCTEVEIASFFRMSIDALVDRCKEHYGMTFAEVRPLFSEDGKISLRRYQFDLAKKNPAMAIWLGKQQLGQKEPKQEIDLKSDVTQRQEGPVTIVVEAVYPSGVPIEQPPLIPTSGTPPTILHNGTSNGNGAHAH